MSLVISTYREFCILSYGSFTFWSSSQVWLLGLIPFFFFLKKGSEALPRLPAAAFNLLCLHWAVTAVSSLSLVVARGPSLWSRCLAHCGGLSHGAWPLGCAISGASVGSADVAHGRGCPAACGVFLNQGVNPCPQRWQVDFLNYQTTREVQA